MIYELLSFALSVTFLLSLLPLLLRRYCHNYPPGPRGPPFIGAAFSMPQEREWLTYAQWKERYGPIVSIRAFGQTIIILNTAELAHDLLEKKNDISANRPFFPMLHMMGMSPWNVGTMRYGPELRLSRRLMLRAMSLTKVLGYRTIQEQEVSILLKALFESPVNFAQHLRRLSTGLIMQVFFGHSLKRDGMDDYVQLNDDVINATSLAGSPAAYIVNTFPILRFWPAWLPGGNFKRDAKNGRIMADKLRDASLGLAETHISEADSVESFLASHLQSSRSPERKAAALAAAITSYGAGVETSTSLLLTFILAMVLYPDAQLRAQQEIDRVIPDRLPTLEDRELNRLPFIDAIIMECYRWAPPGTFGLPHCLTETTVMSGYTLPKGAIVMSNIWSILHDEHTYSSPMEFLPERYQEGTNVQDPRVHVFGYGKRACPGKNLAESMLWLTIASILTAFNITPEVGNDGQLILPDINDYTSGVMRRPKDFRCRILPRSAMARDLVV